MLASRGMDAISLLDYLSIPQFQHSTAAVPCVHIPTSSHLHPYMAPLVVGLTPMTQTIASKSNKK